MAVIINVDYKLGQSLPDSAIKDFVKETLSTSLKQVSNVEISVGSELIITAFRHYVKALDLGSGYVVLKYSNGVIDTIDADGMVTYVHPEATLVSELLISLV